PRRLTIAGILTVPGQEAGTIRALPWRYPLTRSRQESHRTPGRWALTNRGHCREMACLLARGQGRAMGSTTVHYACRSSSRGLGSTDRIHRLYVLRSFGVKVCALVAVSAACLDKTGGPWTLLYCPDSGRASELRRGLRQWRVEVGWQMTHLSVPGVRKSFGSFAAVDGVSFDLAEGEIVALLGASGCGKTTLLRAIGGLVEDRKSVGEGEGGGAGGRDRG